jgi:hypothetical protein
MLKGHGAPAIEKLSLEIYLSYLKMLSETFCANKVNARHSALEPVCLLEESDGLGERGEG